MSVVATVAVAASALPLGTLVESDPEVHLSVEAVVPTTDGLVPYLWVSDEPDSITDRLEVTPEQNRGFGLTTGQRDLVVAAYEAGYFDVPRETTLVELGEELEISDSAVSQRLAVGWPRSSVRGSSPTRGRGPIAIRFRSVRARSATVATARQALARTRPCQETTANEKTTTQTDYCNRVPLL